MRIKDSHCPNGCGRGFQRVTMRREECEKLVCDVCGEEIVHYDPSPMCKCGSQYYTIRPRLGGPGRSLFVRCAKCGEHVTMDSLIAMAETMSAGESSHHRRWRIGPLLVAGFVVFLILAYWVWRLIRS